METGSTACLLTSPLEWGAVRKEMERKKRRREREREGEKNQSNTAELSDHMK